MDFVVDASIALGWLLQSQADALTVAAETALEQDSAWVPNHFGIEVARTLRSQERRGLLTPQTVEDALAHLCDIPLRQDSDDTLEHISTTVALARRHGLRVADAGYLELSLRMGLRLATRDRKLASAAADAGADLLKP
jgi:predicted nucleic acid-binding protein